jgi:N-acetylneuraminic acid mutarotase
MEVDTQFNSQKLSFRTWEFACSIPVGRQGVQPMQYNNQLYFYSGRVATQQKIRVRSYANDFWRLDLETMLWTSLTLEGDFPCARMNYSVATWNGKGYLFGGCGDDGIFDDLYSYDFSTNIWTKLGQIKNTIWPPITHAHTAVVYKDSMYIFGGASRNKDLRVYFNDIWEYDLINNLWKNNDIENKSISTHNKKEEDLPKPRSYHSAVVCKDFMFIFGGFWMKGKQEYYFDDSWIYNFANQTWIQINPSSSSTVPRARNRQTCVLLNEEQQSFLFHGGNFFERGISYYKAYTFLSLKSLNF